MRLADLLVQEAIQTQQYASAGASASASRCSFASAPYQNFGALIWPVIYA